MKIATLKKMSRAMQWVFIRRIIARDANGKGALYVPAYGHLEARFCVVGGIAAALGWKPNVSGNGGPYDMVARIPVMSSERVTDFWHENDKHWIVMKRRAALLALTNRFERADALNSKA